EIDACPEELILGQGDDQVRMVHRDVEGDQESIVVAGIQTAPFSDEEMMFKIYKGCAMDQGIDRQEANDLLARLARRLEGEKPLQGNSITDCYDLIHHRTSPDYEKKHVCVKKELNNMGLKMI
ncbi:MAG: hypothetical protein KAV87_02975, partial [Desulfobacteraceae bacterium]|nr:hypothetical protein [Desulfobacteraceae bacterium]